MKNWAPSVLFPIVIILVIANSLQIGFSVDNHVIINEVELNPVMSDGGAEYVELYNPTNTTINLRGWKMTTTNDKEFELDGASLDPGEYSCLYKTRISWGKDGGGWVIGIKWLDNDGFQVTLWDSRGNQVDTTPMISDTEYSSRTWQRYPDASDNWEFRPMTKRRSNGGEQVEQIPEILCLPVLGLLMLTKAIKTKRIVGMGAAENQEGRRIEY